MKKLSKLLSLALALCMLLSVSAFASSDTTASAEPGEVKDAPVAYTGGAVQAASDYEYLTNYTNRKTPGSIFIGHDETGKADIVLNDAVIGEGYTSVYAHGANADVTVSGALTLIDNSDGQNASDFSGQASATVVYDNAKLTLKDLDYYSEGFERGVVVISNDSIATIENSDITVMGADALHDAWEGYHSSADQSYMISPPWCLGLYGGGRILNMIGTNPTLVIKDSVLTGGETWGILSTDSGSNMMINVVDSELTSLPESKGGSDSGWRIFGYDEDAYGSAYGAYYIGGPTQNYYGTTFNGVTYAAIITGAQVGHYASSNGNIDLYDANGNLIETVQGKGQPTVINGVFGFMQHNSISDALYIEDGTIINSADAIIIQKAANGKFVFDNAVLNSAKGVLFQMIDNDDDSRIGGNPMNVMVGFSETYSDSKLTTSGIGFPGVNYAVDTKSGGNTVEISYTNGTYEGNIYNGTGYYGQSGDNMVVTIGENATLKGDIALTSTIKGVPYSPEAIEGIAYYGDDIQYVLLDAEGNETADPAKAAFIQITDYTMNEYFLQGHVENMIHFNGVSTIDVTVAAGAEWDVAGESLLTGLTVEQGAVVKGTLVENADGSVTITAGNGVIAAGTYGGNVEAVGGGINVGGGVDANGELNVDAAAAAIADPGAAEAAPAASGEPSAEPTAATVASILIATSLSAEPSGEPSPEPSGEPSGEDDADKAVIVIGGQEYKLDVYTIDGEAYVKLADLTALFGGADAAAPAADGDWAAYQEYLISAAGGNAPNLDEFKGQVYALNSWDDVDLSVSPWDMLFTTVGISTFADFQAGQANASQVEGAMG